MTWEKILENLVRKMQEVCGYLIIEKLAEDATSHAIVT